MTDRRPPRPTRIALPWWDALLLDARDSGAAVDTPAMSWLQARSARRVPAVQPWRDWLLESAGPGAHATARFPAGPCVRLASHDADGAAGDWAVAQPVHLATAIDHLRMAPLHALDILPDEAQALQATLRGHLAGTGHDLLGDTPETWCLSSAQPLDCATFDPADAIGRNVHDFMPSGRDGKTVRSLMNEIQMLLHEHPVNLRRARNGLPAINSLWLWGFGELTPPTSTAMAALATDDPWLTGLWKHHGSTVTAQFDEVTPEVRDGALVAMTRPCAGTAAEALAAADAGLLQALRRVVAGHATGPLEIHTGTQVVVLDAWSRWRFWRRPAAADTAAT